MSGKALIRNNILIHTLIWKVSRTAKDEKKAFQQGKVARTKGSVWGDVEEEHMGQVKKTCPTAGTRPKD